MTATHVMSITDWSGITVGPTGGHDLYGTVYAGKSDWKRTTYREIDWRYSLAIKCAIKCACPLPHVSDPSALQLSTRAWTLS